MNWIGKRKANLSNWNWLGNTSISTTWGTWAIWIWIIMFMFNIQKSIHGYRILRVFDIIPILHQNRIMWFTAIIFAFFFYWWIMYFSMLMRFSIYIRLPLPLPIHLELETTHESKIMIFSTTAQSLFFGMAAYYYE